MSVAIPGGHATVFLVGAGGGGLRRLVQFGMKHLIDVVATGPPRRPGFGWRSRCCARWSPPTICCGGSPARRPPIHSWRSPATSGATCSAICPATRRAFSPSGCRAGWPAASLPPPTTLHDREHRLVERHSADVAVVCCRSPSSARSTPRGGRAGRRWPLLLGALIFYLARRGTPLHRSFAEKAAAVDGELVDVIGNFDVVRAFGATFREQKPHRRHHRRRNGARAAAA